ncbi:MAG: hypothetical protein ACYCXW_19840, partial [Solirubrobacteraceae bacterium]
MPPVAPRRRRARPVADAPIQPLLAHPDELAKGWLLALVEQSRLQDAPAILAAPLSREGPALCDAALRAIGSDQALRRLERDGPLRRLAERAGELAGARTPPEAARAVDALHGVLWAALRDELRGADAELVLQLSERLGLVAEVLRGAALESIREPSRPPVPAPPVPAPPPPVASSGGRRMAEPPPPVASSGGRRMPEPPPPDAPADPAPAPHAARAWPGTQDGQQREPRPGLWIHALRDEIERSEPGSLS